MEREIPFFSCSFANVKNDGTPLGLRGENRFGVDGVSVMFSMCRLYNAVRSRFDSLDFSIKHDRHLFTIMPTFVFIWWFAYTAT